MRLARLSALFPLLFLAAFASAQSQKTSATQPVTQPAIQPATQAIGEKLPFTFEKIVRQNPPLRAYVVKLDLTDPRVSVAVASGGADPDGAGPWETVLQPTSEIAKANQLDIAINGVFFAHGGPTPKSYLAGTKARGVQMVVSEGKTLCPAVAGASMLFDKEKRATIGVLHGVPKDAYNIMSGSMLVAFRGRNESRPDDDRAPRTAVGLTKDGKTLVIYVVDGRRLEWSVGLSIKELGDEMLAQGCDAAINLDGGGSSTLVMREGEKLNVINLPSDGSQLPIALSIERPVPYVLGFRIKGMAPTTQAATAPATQSVAPGAPSGR